MKLEINPIAKQDAGNLASDEVASLKNEASAKAAEVLKRGISAAKAGNRHEARTLLLRVTEADSKSETAWLWLASISEYPEELLVFLQNVLSINPENQRALDWTKQTKTLLAKNFVQRGIAASQENQKDVARQSFLQAIGHDSQNEMAWLWLASIVDSAEEKISHLQKVLAINPENSSAITSLKSIKHQIGTNLLKKANQAFVSGNRERAKSLVEQTIASDETIEDAWILKAHLADSFDEKVQYFKRVLDVNPDNQAAQSGLMSVQSVMQSVAAEAEVEELESKEEVSNEVVEASSEEAQTEVLEEVAEEVQTAAEPIETENTRELNEINELNVAEETSAEVAEEHFVNDEVVEYQEPVAEEAAHVELHSHEEVETQIDLHVEDVVATVKHDVAESVSETGETVEVQQSVSEEVLETSPEVETELVSEEVVSEEAKVEEFVAESAEMKNEALADVTSETFQTHSESANVETAAEAEFEAESQNLVSEVAQSEDAQTEVAPGIPVELHHEEADYKSHEFTLQEEILDIKPVQRENSQVGVYSFSKFGDGESHATAETVEFNKSETHLAADVPVQDEVKHEEVSFAETNSVEAVEAATEYVETQTAEPAELANEAISQEQTVCAESEVVETAVEETVGAVHHEASHQEESVSFHEENNDISQAEVEVEIETAAVVEESKVEFVSEVKEETYAAIETTSDCPFCETKNREDSISCKNCHAIFDMSDLDLILENTLIDSEVVFQSIQSMELDKLDGEFSDENFAILGMAYLNVKDLKNAHENLKKSLHLNPMKVSLNHLVKELGFRLQAEESKVEETVAEVKSESRTIMVIDDSPTVRKLISSKLERHGHTVVSAIDGMDALAKINEVTPDLILLDITMPKLDGYQVCKLIRNNDATKGVPVIMISGKDGFFDKVRGKMAGSNGFISKPFGPEILMKTLNTFAR